MALGTPVDTTYETDSIAGVAARTVGLGRRGAFTNDDGSPNEQVIVGVSVGAAFLLAACIWLYCMCKKSKQHQQSQQR
ncbi:hypothetical protein IWW51_000911 [Coemansia sp. RSA 2702]|nr:hypothetical protein IWW54_003058 [Coemansia sp. RSA 2705]KAJ2328941.1 hypothetical protein IWW51_000911 [Coemansia sp. RSA 2702]